MSSALKQAERLRVVFVIDGMWVGGSERSLAEMLPLLMDAGIAPTVVCFRRYPEEGVEDLVVRQGIELHFVEQAHLWRRVLALRELIRRQAPHLVHTSLFNANVAGSLAAWKLNVPVLNSLVSMPYEPIRYHDPRINAGKLRIVQSFDGWLARHRVTHFHAVSHAMKRAAVAALGVSGERITVIHRGRDPLRLGEPGPERRLRMRRTLGLRDDDRVLVNIGREEYPKGHRYLVEAMQRLAPAYPRLTLLIAGRTGAVTPELRRLCSELGVEDRIRFLGHRTDVPDLLAAADVFVFPSLSEALPGAVIEAMALGLPIVASDLDSVRELVEEGGNAWLVEPACSAQLADAIRAVLGNPEQARAYGVRSRQLFLERFTLEQSAGQMVGLFRKVARPA